MTQNNNEYWIIESLNEFCKINDKIYCINCLLHNHKSCLIEKTYDFHWFICECNCEITDQTQSKQTQTKDSNADSLQITSGHYIQTQSKTRVQTQKDGADIFYGNHSTCTRSTTDGVTGSGVYPDFFSGKH